MPRVYTWQGDPRYKSGIDIRQQQYRKMLEVECHFSDNSRGIDSYCTKGNSKQSCLLPRKPHVLKNIRVIDDIVPHDRPLRSDGTQHATEKQVKIF